MKEIVIPKTELKVSALCLGGGPHGVDPEESEKVLDYYLASGGNFIDTANIYGQWKPGGGVSVSERFLGKYIKSRKCRNRIVLDTKGAAPHFDTMHVPRVSRKDILHDIDDSLKNLQVDYVDLYWLHHDDEKISVEEIIDTLVDLVREGKIRYFGCSNWNTARIREALDYSRKKKIPEFVGNQVMYNLAKYNQERLDQEIMFGMTSEMYALHKKEGLAVMCYSSQAQGYFSCADKEDFMENPVYDNPREFYENEISRLMYVVRLEELRCRLIFSSEDRAWERYTRLREKGQQAAMPKVTSDESRKTLLKAITWKYDWIQQHKKQCFRFAEAVYARQMKDETSQSRFIEAFIQYAANLPEPNRRLLDEMYELAWYDIQLYPYSLEGKRLVKPWYDTKESGDGKC